MLKVPNELQEYIDFEDGKIIEVKEVPEDLKDDLEDFKEIYELALDPKDLAEY